MQNANEIVSCVFDRLNRLDLANTVRLVADGCGAQNKNTIMIGMLAKWLLNAPSHVQDTELVFPIPGHSFLPADRVFGNIERELKKKEVIISPEEYHEIFSNYGTINKVDAVYNWKSALHDIIKPPGSWHFQFPQSKRFFIKKETTKYLLGGSLIITQNSVNINLFKKRENLSWIYFHCRCLEMKYLSSQQN